MGPFSLGSSAPRAEISAPTFFMNYRHVLAMAAIASVVMTTGALLVPPAMTVDTGWGFLAMRGWLQGAGFSVVREPNPADIATDIDTLVTWWSPGQYLVPALFRSFGLSVGAALALTSGLAYFAALSGWTVLLRRVGASAGSAAIVVTTLACVRYSTRPFDVYNGGEVLLQGVLPWMLLGALAACRRPVAVAVALGAALALVGFVAKLTGLIVAIAAVGAAVVHHFAITRRASAPSVGLVVGAITVVACVQLLWISAAPSAASPGQRTAHLADAFFLLIASGSSGFGLADLGAWLFMARPVPFATDRAGAVALVAAIPACVVFLVVASTAVRSSAPAAGSLRLFIVLFAAIYLSMLAVIVLGGGQVSIDERHLRSAGTALLVLAIVVAVDAPLDRWKRAALLGVVAVACTYGVRSHANYAWMLSSSDRVDARSRTVQNIAPDALAYVQKEAVRRGPSGIVVLPSPEIGVALPDGTRTLGTVIEWDSLESLERKRYSGRSTKGIVLIVPAHHADDAKGRAMRHMFAAYRESEWRRHEFGATVVFTTDCTTACGSEHLAASGEAGKIK